MQIAGLNATAKTCAAGGRKMQERAVYPRIHHRCSAKGMWAMAQATPHLGLEL